MNNKQRIYIIVLFLIWFEVMVQHLHINLFIALLFNSIIIPMCMSLPCLMMWDYLGGKKIPYIDAPG